MIMFSSITIFLPNLFSNIPLPLFWFHFQVINNKIMSVMKLVLYHTYFIISNFINFLRMEQNTVKWITCWPIFFCIDVFSCCVDFFPVDVRESGSGTKIGGEVKMAPFKSQMLWESIKSGDLTAVHGLLESGNINLEERDEVSQSLISSCFCHK